MERLLDFAAADWARGANPVVADLLEGFLAAADCTLEAAFAVIEARLLPPPLVMTITSMSMVTRLHGART